MKTIFMLIIAVSAQVSHSDTKTERKPANINLETPGGVVCAKNNLSLNTMIYDVLTDNE